MFRTAFIDSVLYDKALKVKEKGLLFDEQPFQFSNLNPVSTQSRGRTGTALRPQVFQTSASTDSAIWAFLVSERWINSLRIGLQMYLNSL